MRQALALATRGAGHTSPNPMVGAVVVRDGQVVGQGWHARFGAPHAEVVALSAAGAAAAGATMYVTLEPCAHHGKTPPCTGALLAAGIRRVVFAAADPNPLAAGGASWLHDAGIQVHGGVLQAEAEELNAPFLFAARGATRPFVTLKLALSIDGCLVGSSRVGWLTGASAKRAVHALRAQSDAVAVGLGTVLADDPMLTVREGVSARVAPMRVVFDRHARLPLRSALVRSAAAVPVLAVTDGSATSAEQRLREAGVEILVASSLGDALEQLHRRDVRHLLVEGGAELATAFVASGLVHRLITFHCPVILGRDALRAFAALPGQQADTAPRLRVIAREECGADFMTTFSMSGD